MHRVIDTPRTTDRSDEHLCLISKAGYTPFCDIMSQVSHVLEELASKMGLSLDASVSIIFSPQSVVVDLARHEDT
jgi:hypothetical protein